MPLPLIPPRQSIDTHIVSIPALVLCSYSYSYTKPPQRR